MSLNTVNISFQRDLLKKIDKIAKDESRTRSELIREAARMYIEKRSRWNKIFDLGSTIQKKVHISEDEVIKEIKIVRNSISK
jgi:CopG family transcriptional regulator / antitoxin EndoAI